MPSLFLIWNPTAGKGDGTTAYKNAVAYLDSHKIPYTAAMTEYVGHATKLAKEAVDAGYEEILILGGDGTIREAASSIIHTDAIMGLLPCGSGNDLVRPLPRAVRSFLENGKPEVAHAVFIVVVVLPAAHHALVLEDIVVSAVEVFELIGRVNVEYEYAVRVEVVMHEGETAVKIARLAEVIYPVEAAHRGVHRAVQLELSHVLAQPEYIGDAFLLRGFSRHGEHFGRDVHGGHVKSAPPQGKGHGARAAAEIEDARNVLSEPLEARGNKIRPRLVVGLAVQFIVSAEKCGISAVCHVSLR